MVVMKRNVTNFKYVNAEHDGGGGWRRKNLEGEESLTIPGYYSWRKGYFTYKMWTMQEKDGY